MSNKENFQTIDRSNLARKLVWVLCIALIFLVGLIYLPREYGRLGFMESIYHILRLFVLENDLPYFPESWPLILIVFAAPLVTVSAIWYGLRYLLNFTPLLRCRWMSNHVIVCGVGRTGKLLVKTLKKQGIKTVGIDLGPPGAFDTLRAECRFPIVFGDFHSKDILLHAGGKRARAIVFSSGEDLANLEGAITSYELLKRDHGQILIIWAHVADERLADTARGALQTSGSVGIRFFDTYRIAAQKMLDQHFTPNIRRGVNSVTIIGFGKFGRDLYELLVLDLSQNENIAISVIDVKNRQQEVEDIAANLGSDGFTSFLQADVRHLYLEDQPDKAFFICTDDDLGNLATAMMLANKIDCNHIYVRMSAWPLSAIADHLGENRGVTFVNINDLVVDGIDHLKGIFQPSTKEDLKVTPENSFRPRSIAD